jgi:hypothetical protein
MGLYLWDDGFLMSPIAQNDDDLEYLVAETERATV